MCGGALKNGLLYTLLYNIDENININAHLFILTDINPPFKTKGFTNEPNIEKNSCCFIIRRFINLIINGIRTK